MRCCCTALVAALALAFTLSDEASAQKKPKPPTPVVKHHPFHGVVVKVHHHKDPAPNTPLGHIIVKHHTHNKKTGVDVVVERTFHIAPATTFERVDVTGKGKTAVRTTTASEFSHVHHGQHVTVHHKGELATDVKIVHHHNK